jgi:periplasmic protein TonB
MPSLAEPLESPPNRPQRRRADRQEGRQSKDRLTTMLVLAALAHGLLLLGISFSAPRGGGDANRGLEVLMVSDELPEVQQNDSAAYLAQRSQQGAGNADQTVSTQLPSREATPAAPEQQWKAETRDDQVLFTTANGRTRFHLLPLPEALADPAEPAPEPPAPPQAGEEELRLRGAQRDEYYLAPDTRATPFAPYLYGWKERVEQIGTVNYPSEARRRGLSGNPVIEVQILRDGKLQSARIQRSSGHPEIDAAALAILRLASPFDPFPPELARDYRSLRFAYEWQFEGGQTGAGALTVP